MRRLRLPSTLRSEQGVSLMELLVAMLSGTVVMIAMIGLLVFSTTQTSRINERVEADRLGRTVMTRITDELHSSCTGFGTNAIQGPSSTPTAPLESTGPLNLWFISAYGTSTSGNAIEKTVFEHDIRWESKGTNNSSEAYGSLYDYSFESTSGSGPGSTSGKWEFPALKEANAKKTLLSAHVIPMKVSGANTIFQYYTVSSETGSFTLLTKEFSVAATSNTVAKLSINFTQGSEKNGESKLGRAVPFNDGVLLRLDPTETGETAKDEPCT
jgi:hypothetical protein